MQITSVFALLAVVFAGFVSAQVPIPNRPDGYGVGGPADAHVVIEMFLDLLCPDCQASWPIALQVIQAYGTKIHFRIHTFPLPYHTNAFLVAQGLHVVANATNRDLDAIFQYATKVFANQEKWYNAATLSLTMTQVLDSVATFAESTGLVTKDKFLAGIASPDINFETRVSWKYTCSRGATGTPTFLINGVAVGADASWSLADWKTVIDPLLASTEESSSPVKESPSPVEDCPAGRVSCEYLPKTFQCCLPGENCIANVGCRCLNLKNGNKCESSPPPVKDCPAGRVSCEYLPKTFQCCLPGENCIANVGCRC